MLRFIFPILTIAGVSSMVACSGPDPVVADEANNAAAAPADVDVLPPDESVATSSDDLENGATEGENISSAAGTAGAIPASFQGRWALTPADCTSTRGDNKGLMTVTADTLTFYEARAKPEGELKRTSHSVSGEFAFTGEGQSWKKYQVLDLQSGKLVRTESDPMASYTYARCTS